MKQLGLYLHIPFCVKKCGYCDFLSMPAGKDVHKRYVEALLKEIRGCGEKYRFDLNEYEIKTLYIGGGTPSVIDPVLVENLLECLEKVFGIGREGAKGELLPEITIEVNPGTVTGDKLARYRRAGINRLSIGLQSADDKELEALGRIHTCGEFVDTYYSARESGFDNINVDIMTAIPYQTMESLERTIDTVVSLDPPPGHISAYSLILEKGTPFFERYGSGHTGGALPDEDEERAMYHNTVERLEKNGFHRYEISNFARPGYESRHNSSYWRRTDYLGLGLGASSLINDIRYRNTEDIAEYMEDPVSDRLFDESIRLSREDCMDEFMFLGLRMSEGVSEEEFFKCFGIQLRNCYCEELEKLAGYELIKEEKGRISLTGKGIDYGNYVFSHFVRS